ncbi:hypothetical protein [Methanocaldococcus fervens]|uniref:Uncharacterized protein n=1 Tax=Methanocaldococcus fervens (strain DSM 4213 / JCM 15782 / AG86) TaxID=573064 RepID=C7P6J9_METFA|nr:hypothetical protein [Methanocaldococcus fervens]ACV24181.1 hypothetical protein Mefer_0346 [Methanocaldococcus fervens AG86]
MKDKIVKILTLIFKILRDIVGTTYLLWIFSFYVLFIEHFDLYWLNDIISTGLLLFFILLFLFTLGFSIFVESNDKNKRKDNISKIIEFTYQVSKATTVLGIIFSLIIVLCPKNLEIIYNIVKIFEIKSISQIFNELYSKNSTIVISIAVSSVLTYLYILIQISRHGKTIFNKKNFEKISIQYLLLQNFYGYFNFFIIPFLLLPFLAHNFRIIEMVCIVALYYLTYKTILPMVSHYINITFSYESLDIYNKNKDENLTLFFISNNNKLSKFVITFAITIITVILNHMDLLQTSIVILIFVVFITFQFLEFNGLTIAYAIFTLTIWYAIFSVVKEIPNNKADICLTNDEKIKDVYIIEDNPEDILVLDEYNKITKIMKRNIIKIEYKKP